jgi:hypothetical protein
MHQGEIAGFMKALAPVIGDFVVKAIAPLRAENKRLADEVAALKSAQDALPKAVDEAEIARLVEERVARIPPALPGKDADPEVVAALVDKALAALDIKGEPGTSVSIDDVTPLIEEAVAKRVAALPAAEPGKSVTVDDVAPMIGETVGKAIAALELPSPDMAMIAQMIGEKVEDAVKALPAAEPGKSVTVEDVRPLIEEMVAALPLAAPGKSVAIEDFAPLIAEETGKAVSSIEIPKPDEAVIARLVGEKVETVLAEWERPKDGAPGKSVRVEDLAPMVAAEIEKAVAGVPVPKDGIGLAGALIDREGQLVVTMTDGTARSLGVVVGKDVDLEAVAEMVRGEVAKIPVPKDGVDGVGFDDMALVDVEGDLYLRFTKGEVVKDFYLPVPTDRGVWVEREFKQGAGVTWGGSFWIAQRDTAAKPDTPDSGWRLAVKRGRDGASAFDVARKAGFRGSEREWLDSLRPGPAKPVKVG